MSNLCENCSQNLADKRVMNGSMIVGPTYNVCWLCRDLLLASYGFVEVSTPLSPAQHKGYHADFQAQSRTNRDPECECGNKDKPRFTQLHSDWCKVYKREFR